MWAWRGSGARHGALIDGGRGMTFFAPKTSFAVNPTSSFDLRSRLDSLHGQIRLTNDTGRLRDLVDESENESYVASAHRATPARGAPP